MINDMTKGADANVTTMVEIVHPKWQPSALCPVCQVKFRAGSHRRKCMREHRIKWFFYRLFRGH